MDFCKSSVLMALLLVFVSSQVEAGMQFNYTGPPVECYECSSHLEDQGEACNDPINIDMVTKKECASGICYKYVQNIENDIKQINRGCAAEIEPVLIEKKKQDEGGCVLSTGTKMIQAQICNCMTATCNGVSGLTSASTVLLSAGLLCLLAKLFQ